MNYYHLIAFAQQLKQNNMSNKPTHNPTTFDGFDSPLYIWEEKVGYDSANKKMIAKVYKRL